MRCCRDRKRLAAERHQKDQRRADTEAALRDTIEESKSRLKTAQTTVVALELAKQRFLTSTKEQRAQMLRIHEEEAAVCRGHLDAVRSRVYHHRVQGPPADSGAEGSSSIAEDGFGELIQGEKERAKKARHEIEHLEGALSALRRQRADAEADKTRLQEDAQRRKLAALERRHGIACAKQLDSEVVALQHRLQHLGHEEQMLRVDLMKEQEAVLERGRELKSKNKDLEDIRRVLVTLQDDMDGVNHRLQAQCNRVHDVEGSLKLSHDLEQRVEATRSLVRESDDALMQACEMLASERSERESLAADVRKQKVRTELMLQMLHHLKLRTQDLAPHGTLREQSFGPQLSHKRPFPVEGPET